MSEDTRLDAVNRLLVAAYGLTAEQVLALPEGVAERVAGGRIADRAFENAAKDFITIVATTDCIPAGDDRLRAALIAAVQTVGARQWATAANGSDAEFEALRRGEKPWVFALLALLRATRRAASETEAGRYFLMHGAPSPTRYREAGHQERFMSLLRLAGEEL
jgi:hypothetical protein